MKKVLICLSVGLIGVGCAKKMAPATLNDATAPESKAVVQSGKTIEATVLKGYFLKNDYQSELPQQVVILPDQVEFSRMLGVAKTMDNVIDAPDFSKNVVAAVVTPQANVQTTIAVERIAESGQKLRMEILVTQGGAQSHTSQPVLVFQFPKPAGISQADVEIITKEGGKQVRKSTMLVSW